MDAKRKAEQTTALVEMAPPKRPKNELVAMDSETQKQLMAAVSATKLVIQLITRHYIYI